MTISEQKPEKKRKIKLYNNIKSFGRTLITKDIVYILYIEKHKIKKNFYTQYFWIHKLYHTNSFDFFKLRNALFLRLIILVSYTCIWWVSTLFIWFNHCLPTIYYINYSYKLVNVSVFPNFQNVFVVFLVCIVFIRFNCSKWVI